MNDDRDNLTITRNLIKVDNTYLRIFQRISIITMTRIISNAPPNPTTRPTISPSFFLPCSPVPAAVEVVELEVVFLEVVGITAGEIVGVDLMVIDETDRTNIDVLLVVDITAGEIVSVDLTVLDGTNVDDADIFVLKDVTMDDVADSPGVVTALAVLVVFLAVDDLVTFDFTAKLDSVVPHTQTSLMCNNK